MNPKEKSFSLRILILITNSKLADKATEMFNDGSIPMHYKLSAMGTASSDMMDILGLGTIDKNILLSIMPKHFADEMLRKMRNALSIGMPNTGIAFTIPLSGANSLIMRMLAQIAGEDSKLEERKGEISMSEMNYVMIASIVNQGYSEEVMNAAKKAGASGGSVLHSRRIGNEKAMAFWGLSIQEEKEIVLIAADAEKKLDIMRAIGEACGMRSEAKGIVVSVPIDMAIGLND